jgi:hypothetical protein
MAVEDILLISARNPATEKAIFESDALQWEMHVDLCSSRTTGTGSPQDMFFYFKYHITLVDSNDVSREKAWKGKWLREGEFGLARSSCVVVLDPCQTQKRVAKPDQRRSHASISINTFTLSVPQLPIAIEYPQ